MAEKPKVFAMYLPQYHEIEENSRFWGKGFTDWVGVKNSKPLYKFHRQPRIPLNNNYYDLSNVKDIRWQCQLAKDVGIEGFCIYHYWFNDKQNLLDTPPKLILENKDIDIAFFFAWDNTSWVRSWSKIKGNDWYPSGDNVRNGESPQVLIEYELGNEPQWEKHFSWLLPYFMDRRYEKKDNKPVFVILNPSEGIVRMTEYWKKLAREVGFDGIHFIFRWDAVHRKDNALVKRYNVFKYEPSTTGWGGILPRAMNRISRILGNTSLKTYDYDKIWKRIIRYAEKNENQKMIYCAFVDYDDTPRRGKNGKIVEGMTQEKFYNYFKNLYELSYLQSKDYMFITAWNEWGEGAYLEPDEDNKDDILQLIKRVLME